jgi:hypothetical protein
MPAKEHWQFFLQAFAEGLRIYESASTPPEKYDASLGMAVPEPSATLFFEATAKFDTAVDMLELTIKGWPQHRRGLETLKKAVYELEKGVHHYGVVDEAITQGDFNKSRKAIDIARRSMSEYERLLVKVDDTLPAQLANDLLNLPIAQGTDDGPTKFPRDTAGLASELLLELLLKYDDAINTLICSMKAAQLEDVGKAYDLAHNPAASEEYRRASAIQALHISAVGKVADSFAAIRDQMRELIKAKIGIDLSKE